MNFLYNFKQNLNHDNINQILSFECKSFLKAIAKKDDYNIIFHGERLKLVVDFIKKMN